MRRTSIFLLALLLAGVFAFSSPMDVTYAATLVVDSAADTNDVVPGNGVCDDGTGACTLRAAIEEANALAGADTITLPAGTYTLSLGSSLAINSELTLSGADADTTVIEAATAPAVANFSVLLVNGNVAISGVTIRHGDGGDFGGGGIRTNGPLTLSDSIITNNKARFGAGIRNNGSNRTITIINTTISNNTAVVGGGGIINNGTLIMSNSTVSGNVSGDSSGGGIFNTIFGAASLTNSTISGNFGGRGGGIENRGTLTVTNSTISNNTATITGAGINHAFGDSFGGTVTLKNTIIANSSPAGDCAGAAQFTSLGHNLAGDGTCNLTESTDQPSTDPLLDPLADNGGPTLTHALLDGSPAIDAADTTAGPLFDQRGIERPQGSDSDIGAFELVQTKTVAIDIKPGSDPNCFNNDGRGVIPVAILGAEDSDVSQIDPDTVNLESLGVKAVGKSDKLLAHLEDVNADGFIDLVLQIEDVDGAFESGSGTATLTGALFDGTLIEGTDEICVVP